MHQLGHNEKRSVLAYKQCNAVLDEMNDLLKEILSGTSLYCLESELIMKAGTCSEMTVHQFPPTNQRTFINEVVNDQVSRQPDCDVLRVRVGSKDFAIDLAGAQYGWQEPVFRWTDHLRERVTNGKTYNPKTSMCTSLRWVLTAGLA